MAELSPITWSILELLGQEEASADLEIGGGIALWHYSPHRSTNDIDAWCWRLWKKKCRDVPILAAQANVLEYLNALEARRPLDSIPDPHERAQAQESRASIRDLATLENEDAVGL